MEINSRCFPGNQIVLDLIKITDFMLGFLQQPGMGEINFYSEQLQMSLKNLSVNKRFCKLCKNGRYLSANCSSNIGRDCKKNDTLDSTFPKSSKGVSLLETGPKVT
jgi:hypothetical protein